MQVLSQLSYNPTIGPLVRPDIGGRSRLGRPSCSAGEFRVPRAPASTDPGSLATRGSAYCSHVIASAPSVPQAPHAPQSPLDPHVTVGSTVPAMDEPSTLTVGRVARLAGVTVRTLHHYDEIGLLSPGNRSAAGYRRYDEADLDRLQRILFYRELGFGLDDIRTVMTHGSADASAHLRRQHAMLLDRIR